MIFIVIGKYLAVLSLMAFLHFYNDYQLQRTRRVKYYKEEEIMMKADSLLNNWKESEMSKPIDSI